MWPELGIARIWPQAQQLPRFSEYMPNEWDLQNVKKVERNFFYGVLISLAPEYVEQLVLDIRAQRLNANANNAGKAQPIGVDPQWVTQLLAQPYVSK